MQGSNTVMYYFSAGIAILGTIGYHNLVKKIPPTIDPMISIISIYLGVLLLGLILIPFIYSGDKIMASVHQLGWVQLGIAVCILVMELGFILMYRSGWDLSVGNVVTGVFINLALLAVGVAILHERLHLVNMLGVVVCILGVSMIEYHGNHAMKEKIGQIIPSLRNFQFGRIKDERTMVMTPGPISSASGQQFFGENGSEIVVFPHREFQRPEYRLFQNYAGVGVRVNHFHVRGTFAATFLIGVIAALELQGVRLEDL